MADLYSLKAFAMETVGLNIRLNECIGGLSTADQLRALDEASRAAGLARFDGYLKYTAEKYFGIKRDDSEDIKAEVKTLKKTRQKKAFG